MSKPKIVLLVSGKRKCGKDYISSQLLSQYVCCYLLYARIGVSQSYQFLFHFISLGNDSTEIIRISEPIKSHWAAEKGLDLEELLSDGPYKEQYREGMIVWSDSVRKENPGYFCNASISKSNI